MLKLRMKGCSVPCAKEGGSCWGYVKHRGCSPAPRARSERGIQVLPQLNPLVCPKWALLWSPGAEARFPPSLCCHTYQSNWVVMDTGSGWPSGQHPEPQSTEASGSEGTNRAPNTPRSEPSLRAAQGWGPHLCWQPAIGLPSSTGTPGRAPAKPEQPGSHLVCATVCRASAPAGQEPEVGGRSWVLPGESGHKWCRKGCRKHGAARQTRASALLQRAGRLERSVPSQGHSPPRPQPASVLPHGERRGLSQAAGSRRCYFKPPGWELEPSTPAAQCVSQGHTLASIIL